NAPKAGGSAKIIRLAFVVMSVTSSLAVSSVSARSEDGPIANGPMASAPLPPPLPPAPPATGGLRQPQPQPRAPPPPRLAQSGPPARTQASTLHKRHNDVRHGDHSARAVHSQKQPGSRSVGSVDRRGTHTVPQIASATPPPPPQAPFPYAH